MRRLRSLLLIVAGSLAFAAAGYGLALATAISSDADHPKPTAPVTAAVQLRRLTSTMILRGDGGFADPAEITVQVSAPVPIVTRTPVRVGDEVVAGQVLLEVAGRPVIALPGALPAYRDLTVGDTGPDVVQLQQALASLGYDVGEDGTYTARTAAAVAALYDHLGYPPPGAPGAPPGTPATLPMSEVAFVPSLPRRLDKQPGRVGQLLPRTPVRLSGTTLQLIVDLTSADVPLLHPGMRAVVTLPSGHTVTGHLGPVRRSATGGSTTVRLPALSPARARSLVDADVKVTIPLSTTSGAVLLVPLAALSTGADGEVRVQRVSAGGTTSTVGVGVGLSSDGYCEVTPTSGRLAAGDRVVVGR